LTAPEEDDGDDDDDDASLSTSITDADGEDAETVDDEAFTSMY
jgi:hypothetical protein